MHTDQPPSDGRDPLPRHTTPTWEMELLLSAATVFGLMQLPALLDASLYSLMPRFEREVGLLILLPYVYLKSAVQILVIAFLLHLVLRGYWTALVGLRSVYPDGVHWETLRWGPLYTAQVRRLLASLPELVERADNRASQVFGFGIGFAVAMLAPLLLVGATSILAYALHLLLGGTPGWRVLWYWIIALITVPYLVAASFDRVLGRRLAPDSRLARGVSALLSFYLRIGFRSFVNYPLTLFLSRFGNRRGGALLMLVMLLLVGASMLREFWDRLGPVVGQYGPLSVAAPGQARTLLALHYADQRDERGTLSPIPFVSSAVVEGDYLRLFIPYRPTRDTPALRRRCPQTLEAGPAAPQAIGQALDCLALVYPLALDGITLADPQFDLADDPATGLRGVQAMIRVAQLAPGRHELQVGRPRNPALADDEPDEPPYLIPFWR
jgi:hypothetical protein